MPFYCRTAAPNAERVVFIALPRAGKTVLVQVLLVGHPSVVVIDTKHKGDEWEPFAEQHGYVITSDPAQLRRHPLVVFRADIAAIESRPTWGKPGGLGYEGWTVVLRSIRWRGETIVVFDEGQDTLPHQGVHPDARRMATSDAAHGISLWVETQFPEHSDTRVLAAAEHCFSFAQHNQEHLDVIRRRRGLDPAPLTQLEGHDFAYHRQGAQEWELYEPVPLPRWVKNRTVRAPVNSEARNGEAHDVRLTSEEVSPIDSA